MHTASLWLTVEPELLEQVSSRKEELVNGLRGLAHLFHEMAPLFLLCDPRDLGSWVGDRAPAEPGVVATAQSTKTRLLAASNFAPTIYLYDSHPGGIGLADRLFDLFPDLLSRSLEILERCPCRVGCPSCVGPVNDVGRQAKAVAASILRRLLL
jgi:DEAD/DEAH box helicase domain-containing protein